ncbi:DUF4142 domain-containing protein [Sphingoaurantiacus capsulatus]|uniref:DUF4142 domain-containing protein n=1 Tax=Sphingoaurantiacus capsulatus TaxID=1771310 RepID=A0ABV7XCC5_9SPHN
MTRFLIPMTAMLALAACGEGDRTPEQRAEAPAPTAAEMGTAPMAAAPIAAATTAGGYASALALGDLFEIESSKLALEKSNSPEVKKFAQMMVDAHTKSGADLRASYSSAGGSEALPNMLDSRRAGEVEALRGKTALEFDTAYLDAQTKAHEEVVKLHKDFIKEGETGALKAFAATQVPTAEAHLALVKKLDKTGADEPASNPPQ